MKTAAIDIEDEHQLARLQHPTVVVAKLRQQDLALRAARARLPVDVEELRERARLAPLEHIEPPGVVGADAHVIGDEVEQQPHAVGVQGLDQGLEIGLGAELRVQVIEVDDVVAVGRARPRGGDRRGVDVTDAERSQVGDDGVRVGKAEVLVELQAVGGARQNRPIGARP